MIGCCARDASLRQWTLSLSALGRRGRRVGLDELTPFQRACTDAIVASGIPGVEDFNNLGEDVGVGPFPVNIDGTTRVNSAFAYVDPVRDRGRPTMERPRAIASCIPSRYRPWLL